MNANDNSKPTDEDDDAWESLGEVVARVLRNIPLEQEAA